MGWQCPLCYLEHLLPISVDVGGSQEAVQWGLEPVALLSSMAACSVFSPGAVVPSHQEGWTGVCMVTGGVPQPLDSAGGIAVAWESFRTCT